MSIERRATAHHEAAHAVAALVLGLAVDEIQLHEGGGTTRARFVGPADCRAARAWTAAGPIGEARFLGEPMPRTLNGPRWAGDARLVREGLTLFWADGSSGYRNAELLTLHTASTIVDWHWREIQIVARALESRGRLHSWDLEPLGIKPGDHLPPDPPSDLEQARATRALNDYNARMRQFTRTSNRGQTSMTAHLIEGADIGKAGAVPDMQSRVAGRARELRDAILAGRVSSTAPAAVAARDALALIAEHGQLGAPLLAELDRQMSEAAA